MSCRIHNLEIPKTITHNNDIKGDFIEFHGIPNVFTKFNLGEDA